MNRIVIGLVVAGLVTLFNSYPALAQLMPSIKTAGNKRMSGQIKAPEEALTLSRFNKDGKVHILAVLEDNGISVKGVDLSDELRSYEQNSFNLIGNMNFNEVLGLIRRGSRKVTVKYSELLPALTSDRHLAIGINYEEHGKETGQVRPFMFPKLVRTDAAVQQLEYQEGWLLDHEVELGIVFPTNVCAVEELDRMMIGFLVVNDFTDRAELMRKMDSQNVTGGKGFPDAKSKKGFLPTGPYMVIPKNWRAFVKELQLELSVNGAVRQHGNAKDMVWNIDRIVEKSLAARGEKKSYYQEKMVKLFEGECIPANSIIVTGTPSGVVFKAPAKGFIIGTVMRYIFTGAFFTEQMHPYILKKYLHKERKNPRYLKPGDFVESSISYLGTISTTVTAHTAKLGCR
ncbi:fumarylacetoacetate hydrolase family protein [Pedobacter sp. MC2016-15]|uniref:fumarylacetoacetate hydrolase family protein n=1 Tax=Pedobacter sp. MC2016-15 TaxID=2994473 RepID=UPI0022455172|nr:fumarylacetoacetate hydrolase family protein [Pedobacter sp. MC2016-15]MCX2478015.1 fumarylacetoacetate hydrolase family protein [Pedobacter sp. MC2016-15]